MSKKLTLGKIEVAKRQLETAIELFFAESDPVSIHTLASAADEVLADVAKDRGGSPMNLQGQLEKSFPTDVAKKLASHMRKPQNFFKHANRDARATIEFTPEQSKYVMLDACTKFPELAGYCTPPITAFYFWFVITHDLPYQVTKGQEQAFEDLKTAFSNSPRSEFFSLALQVVRPVFLGNAAG